MFVCFINMSSAQCKQFIVDIIKLSLFQFHIFLIFPFIKHFAITFSVRISILSSSERISIPYYSLEAMLPVCITMDMLVIFL